MAAAVVNSTAKEIAHLMTGMTLRGAAGSYALTKKIYDSVLTANKNQFQEDAIIKGVRHWRLHNERDILRHLQHRTSFLRPLIDEIEEPSDPPAIVLKWLDDGMLKASNTKRLTRPEVKYVAKGVLEALKVLHEGGYVHTNVKPSNILINYGTGEKHFKDVQLADLVGALPIDSQHLKDGIEMGTEIFRAPEAHLSLELGPPMDIWSFGATLISLICGGDFHIYKPNISRYDLQYHFYVLLKHYRVFGPWPESYKEIADEDILTLRGYTIQFSPPEILKTFSRTCESEICKEDNEFVCRIMKLDPRDRPTAPQIIRG